jgi:hypothetical protein
VTTLRRLFRVRSEPLFGFAVLRRNIAGAMDRTCARARMGTLVSTAAARFAMAVAVAMQRGRTWH